MANGQLSPQLTPIGRDACQSSPYYQNKVHYTLMEVKISVPEVGAIWSYDVNDPVYPNLYPSFT